MKITTADDRETIVVQLSLRGKISTICNCRMLRSIGALCSHNLMQYRSDTPCSRVEVKLRFSLLGLFCDL
jgi:hypothetical protein